MYTKIHTEMILHVSAQNTRAESKILEEEKKKETEN